MSIVLIIVAGLGLVTIIEQKIIANSAYSAQAYYAAESGIEDSLYRLIKNKSYSASTTLPVGAGSAAIAISDVGTQKYILSKGQERGHFRSLRAKLNTGGQNISASFSYGVQVGRGGLKMDNGSQVEGNIFSNGPILGSAGATVTGNAWVANDSLSANQQSIVNSSDFSFGQANPVIDAAQSFVPSASSNLIKISLLLKKFGSPGNKTVRILTDNAGQPSKTLVNSGAYGTLLASQVGNSSYAWVDIKLNNPASLQAGVKYWILIDSSLNEDAYFISARDANDSYAGGTGKYSQNWNTSSPAWTDIGGDLAFKAWLGSANNFLDRVLVGGNAHANTISDSSITGDAYFQTLTNSTVGGTKYPGSSDPTIQDLPLTQAIIDGWKTEAANGGVITGDYIVDAGAVKILGPKKIEGNLTISNRGDLTVSGTIFVTGNINIFNNAKVRLSSEFNGNSGAVITDGLISVTNSCSFFGASAGSYVLLLSTKSGQAINLANNSDTAIFYAANGSVDVSNNTVLKELIGQQIHLNNGSRIVYEAALAAVKFSSSVSGSWKVTAWEEVP
ncbi:MAG: hypothetical protein PHT44_01385 [Candidatus Portnoybacteria bacterium]|nr:hypothetical protein [Candidatus Portnoybacteria bacterium]MDD4982751.1 hypothetical protein [Candidatus Portnoybacteria bacterium]